MPTLDDYFNPPRLQGFLVIHRATQEWGVGMNGATTAQNMQLAFTELHEKLAQRGIPLTRPFHLDELDILERDI